MRAADAAGADWLGFVFAPSTRHVTPEHARAISAGTRARRVAVVVDPDADALAHIQATFRPDAVQFHGSERAESILEWGREHATPVWKACPVSADPARARLDFARADAYAACDLLLFDAKPPQGAAQAGGHGVSVDWSLVAQAPRPKRFGLAGGLTPDNVARAREVTGATLLDTSSGVESAPGLKDAAKVAAFVRAAKGF